VIVVYVEATGQETELRLLNGLRKRCLGLPPNLDLKGMLTALRRGHGVPVGKKVLIVLDQLSSGCTPTQVRLRANWSRLCGSATGDRCRASSWCGMTSGWR